MPIFTLARYTVRGYLKERILLVVLLFAFLLTRRRGNPAPPDR